MSRRRYKRKHPLLRALGLLLLLFAALLADSNLRIVTTEYTLEYETLPSAFDGFRIVQLSDIHGAEFGAGNRRLLASVRAAEPDIIALTGDLTDEDSDMAVIETLLSGLVEIAPVYYVSGNHEWHAKCLDTLQDFFDSYGVCYLRNESVLLERGDEEIVLAGVEDPNGPKDMIAPDVFAAELRAEYPDDFILLLAHRNNWAEDYPTLPVDLILCGHAHGGIVRLPVLGGLIGNDRSLFPEYVDGVHASGSYRMVISRGLGGIGSASISADGERVFIPRFLNNPEVVAVTLRAAA
ncbi:MAG: metallophosphoesterase [Oscillospiraceae bacterium]|nr:metallophosphoesterase [Oscillospiraceae bacterium]